MWLQEPTSLIIGNLASQIPPTSTTFEMNFAFRTFTSEGILIFLIDSTATHYLLVYFNHGRVVLNISLTGLDFNQLSTTNMYNDGQWYDINIVVAGSSITLTVGSEVKNMEAWFSSTFDLNGALAIGSPQQAMTTNSSTIAQLAAALERVSSIPQFSASGCFRHLRLNGIMVNISESTILLFQQSVSLDGCPAEVSICMSTNLEINLFCTYHSIPTCN